MIAALDKTLRRRREEEIAQNAGGYASATDALGQTLTRTGNQMAARREVARTRTAQQTGFQPINQTPAQPGILSRLAGALGTGQAPQAPTDLSPSQYIPRQPMPSMYANQGRPMYAQPKAAPVTPAQRLAEVLQGSGYDQRSATTLGELLARNPYQGRIALTVAEQRRQATEARARVEAQGKTSIERETMRQQGYTGRLAETLRVREDLAARAQKGKETLAEQERQRAVEVAGQKAQADLFSEYGTTDEAEIAKIKAEERKGKAATIEKTQAETRALRNKDRNSLLSRRDNLRDWIRTTVPSAFGEGDKGKAAYDKAIQSAKDELLEIGAQLRAQEIDEMRRIQAEQGVPFQANPPEQLPYRTPQPAGPQQNQALPPGAAPAGGANTIIQQIEAGAIDPNALTADDYNAISPEERAKVNDYLLAKGLIGKKP